MRKFSFLSVIKGKIKLQKLQICGRNSMNEFVKNGEFKGLLYIGFYSCLYLNKS